jgi:hypothetical protein
MDLITQERPVIFISDAHATRSHIYRVKNAVDTLYGAGIEAWCDLSSINQSTCGEGFSYYLTHGRSQDKAQIQINYKL